MEQAAAAAAYCRKGRHSNGAVYELYEPLEKGSTRRAFPSEASKKTQIFGLPSFLRAGLRNNR